MLAHVKTGGVLYTGVGICEATLIAKSENGDDNAQHGGSFISL